MGTMNNRNYCISSRLLLGSFIFITFRSNLVDTSSLPQDGSKSFNVSASSKNETRKELPRLRRSLNSEGELQIPQFAKLNTAGSRKKRKAAKGMITPSESMASRSGKSKSRFSSKLNSKKSKAKPFKKVKRVSAEEGWSAFESGDDEDIYRKATEVTSAIKDDYDWGSNEDWDDFVEGAKNETRIFNMHSSEEDASWNKKSKNVKARKQSTVRKAKAGNHKPTFSSNSRNLSATRKRAEHRSTVAIDSRNQTLKTANKKKVEENLPVLTSETTQPSLRGFEDEESYLTVEASVVSSQEDHEDNSVTYISIEGSESGGDRKDNETSEREDDYLESENDSDYLASESDYLACESDSDYLESDSDYLASESDYLESKGDGGSSIKKLSKGQKTTGTKKSKRKMALKKQKNWIKEQKRERNSKKRKHRRHSINGMKKQKSRSESKPRRTADGDNEDNRSRASKLGLRRKLGGRDYGRNAGKRVYWKKKKKFFAGARRRFPLRGKAKANIRAMKVKG